jgi:hypothetical protein
MTHRAFLLADCIHQIILVATIAIPRLRCTTIMLWCSAPLPKLRGVLMPDLVLSGSRPKDRLC